MKISVIKFICGCSRRASRLMTAQSGQALPIVLAMIALGAMVTGPFLSQASSGLIGSRVYGQSYNESYAAGAGAEQAMWQLKYGSLADTIPNVGNSTSYTLSDTINNLQPAMTVTRVSGAGGGGGAEGTITKSIIDKLQFDTTGNTPVMVNVSGNIYAVTYRNSANDLILKTMTIQADGTISNTAIGSLIIDGTGYEPSMMMISASVVAIVFRGPSNKGYVATASIDASGNIGNTIDKQIFANNSCYEPEMLNVAGTFYAVVYRGPSNKGYVNTLEIAATGIVTNTMVSTYTNLSGLCYEPDIINVTGTYYAVVFRGASNRGNISTISINTSGIITQSVISNAIFNNTAAYWTKIEQIASGIFATVYRVPPSNDGYITTSSITSNGIINNANINTWVFDSGLGYEPYLIPISGDAYAVVYRGTDADGWLKTITINPDGTLGTTALDSYEFDITNGFEPFMLHVSGNLYAVAYRGGTGTVGYVITIDIATSSTNSFQIVSTAGETTITADVLIDSGAVKVLNWQIIK